MKKIIAFFFAQNELVLLWISQVCTDAFLNDVYPPSSVQRAVYKDIVLLLQKDKYLSAKQLKTKVSPHFEYIVLLVFFLFQWNHVITASCGIIAGGDELWTGQHRRRRLPNRNEQRNRVPGGSAVPVWSPPGPLLLCDTDLLLLHAQCPGGFPPWFKTWCSRCQQLRLGYFKVTEYFAVC